MREEVAGAAFAVAAGLIVADLAVGTLQLCNSIIFNRLLNWEVFPRGFRLGDDGGFGDLFQYAKLLTTAALLTMIYARSRSAVYLSMGVIVAFLLCDDVLQIHEAVGAYIAKTLEFRANFRLRAVDFGELIATAATGTILLAHLGLAYRASGPRERRSALVFVALLLLLVFFGVFMDMLHVAFHKSRWNTPLELMEDGGEMIAVSLIVAYTAYIYWDLGQDSRDHGPTPLVGDDRG